jgi:hypothetical protein
MHNDLGHSFALFCDHIAAQGLWGPIKASLFLQNMNLVGIVMYLCRHALVLFAITYVKRKVSIGTRRRWRIPDNKTIRNHDR